MASATFRAILRGVMSQEPVEVVRTALGALDQRDVDRYLSVASDEIELITPASALQGRIVGHEGIRRFFEEAETFAESSSVEIEEIRPVGARVVAFFTLKTRGRLSAAETSSKVAGVYLVEDGKIRSAHIFTDRDAALETARHAG